MTYDGTVFTSIKLDDKNLDDPNSGFYTAQATTEQINNIPANAKEEGELLYNKTTGSLMLFNGEWNTLNSSVGMNRNIVINSSPIIPTDPVEGEIYYNTTDQSLIAYVLNQWIYLDPKPKLGIIPSSPHIMTLSSTDAELSMPFQITNSHLFSKLSTSARYNGIYGINCLFALTMSGYATGNATIISTVRQGQPDATAASFTSKISLAANEKFTTTICTSMNLENTDVVKILMKATDMDSGITSIDLHLESYSIQITAI